MARSEPSSFDSFERFLQTTGVDLDFLLSDLFAQVLCEFYLSPRYLRGSDFLMRFSQGRWAEEVIVRTINATDDLRAVRYGPSSVAPSEPHEMELYFERLDKAGAIGKRPDLLILPRGDYDDIHPHLDEIGVVNLPFTPEADLDFLHSRAIIAVEVENSLWVARKMPDYGKGVPLTELITRKRRFRKAESMARWEAWTERVRRFCAQSEARKQLKGFLERAKVPTVIIKDEDLEPLTEWEANFNISIFIFHVFYDEAYYISLQEARELIDQGVILPTAQTFYAPSGATTRKYIYKIWYTLAHPLGTMTREPEMAAKFIQDKNGHILPYVHFSGGQMALSEEILTELRSRLR
ncbi:MAG TPA: AccI family restriction endonuclease [Anaerolineae bacterium]|nr:AccI family restriction endonuclease [Anaerolineae bacterium]